MARVARFGAGAVSLSGRRIDWRLYRRHFYEPLHPLLDRSFNIQLDRPVFHSRICRLRRPCDHPSPLNGPPPLHSPRTNDWRGDCSLSRTSGSPFSDFLATSIDNARTCRARLLLNNRGRSYRSHPAYARRCRSRSRPLRLSNTRELSADHSRGKPSPDESSPS